MNVWTKSGLCLVFGWLAATASAQEIQWRAAAPKTGGVARAVAAPSENGSGARPVTIGQPVPLGGGQSSGAFRPFGSILSTARGQAADDKSPSPVPTLEIGGDQKTPKPMPKVDGGFNPPPPQATPGPIFGNLGMTPENGFWNGCCSALCGVQGDCCPDRGRFWATGEYLMWWQRSQVVPPLVTSSPIGNANPIGVLNSPATSVLYNDTPDRTRGGGRFGFGWWSKHFCNLGFDTSFFFIGRQNATSSFGPGTGTNLARPFNSVLLGVPNSEIFVGPGITGLTTITSYSQVWGMEANLRRKWHCGPRWWIDWFAGYRYLNLSEGISINESLIATQNQIINNQLLAAGTQFIENESFTTRNQFNGLQFGLTGEHYFWNRCFFGWNAKLAAGNVYQVININGSTTRILPGGAATTQQGALLATQTNIGRYTDNRFAVLPEVGVKIGYNVTDHWRVFVGYNFLYLSSVVRPGEQIDLNVNSNFRPFTGAANPAGPRLPAVPFHRSDYWAQGVNFGLQCIY